jgi:Fungal specific transcription factor domain
MSKEAIRKEIGQLQGKVRQRERILEALTSSPSAALVLRRLKDKMPLEQIAEQFGRTPAAVDSIDGSEFLPSEHGFQTIVGSGRDPFDVGGSSYWRTYSSDFEGRMDAQRASQISPEFLQSWTETTSGKETIEHLLELYFCWEYGTFMNLSKEAFLPDFRNGQSTYCCALLVNALLAVGSSFSVQYGDPFYTEAKKLLGEQDAPLLTTVQALGLISIYEAGCSRDSESWFHSGQAMHMAIEMGSHIETLNPDNISIVERDFRAVTFWGAFTLDQ